MLRRATSSIVMLGLIANAEARRGGRGSGSYTDAGEALLLIAVSIAALYGLFQLLRRLLQTRVCQWLLTAMPSAEGLWERLMRGAVYAYFTFVAGLLAWFALDSF